jgi:hypothetical protein
MKKLLCIVLALALLLSLSVSALAYEDLTPPLWERWGFNSLEEYLEFFEETEEEYAQDVADYLAERAKQDALIASFDPATHDFTPPLWEYYGYASKAEMMEAWEIDEAGYYEAVDDEISMYERRDWTEAQWDAYNAEQEAAEIQATKEAKGLTLDLNVMVDGKALAFRPDAVPVIRNDCTMAPLGVMAQALNAKAVWDNDSGKISLTRSATAMELAVGSEILSFRTEGPGDAANGGIFYLDSLPYVEGEEVFVPLRAVAEAFGYEVQWSDTYRTAVLLDVEKYAAELDGKFTVMNAVMAMDQKIDDGQTYQGNSKLDLKVSVPMLGDKLSCSGSVSAAVLTNGTAAQGTVTYDMKELLDLIFLLAADGVTAEDSAEKDALAAAMDDGLEMICDLEGAKLYLRGKLFAVATGEEDAGADTWFFIDLSEFLPEMGDLTALAQEEITLGQLICMTAAETGADPIYLQETLDEMAEVFASMDDSHFAGDGTTRHLEYALPDFGAGVIKLDVTMADGKATDVAGSVRLEEDGLKIECTFATAGMNASASGSILVEGTVQVDFTLTADSSPAPAGTVIAAAPPVGAELADLFELLMGGFTAALETPEDLPAA